MRTQKGKIQVVQSARSLTVGTRMWKQKKGVVPIIMTVGAVLLISFAAFGVYKLVMEKGDSSDANKLQIANTDNKVATSDISVDPTGSVLVNKCGLNSESAMNFYANNPLDDDGTATYLNVTLKIKDMNDPASALKSYTTTTTGAAAGTSLTASCPGKYTVYAPAVQNTTASAMLSFEADAPTEDKMIEVQKVDHITVYAYDEKNRGFVYDASDASATDGEELTSAVTFKSTTNNATAYAMGTGSSIDWTFTVYTGTTQTAWGDLKNFVLVDADKSDFATPSLLFNGMPLTEVGMAALKSDDAAYLAGYEYVYALPYDITEQENQLRLKDNAKSGQNPDVDIKVRFVTESLYVDGTQVVQGIFDAGGNEVFTSPAQEITIDVS